MPNVLEQHCPTEKEGIYIKSAFSKLKRGK